MRCPDAIERAWMTARFWVLAAISVTFACSRVNPLFGAADEGATDSGTGGETESATSVGSTVGQSGSTDPSGQTGGGSGAGTSSSGGDGVTTSDSDGTEESGLGSSETGPLICPPEFPEPLGFTFDPPLPQDCNSYYVFFATVAAPGVVRLCEQCPCTLPSTEHQLVFEGVAPTLPDCFQFRVFLGGPTGPTSCEIQSFALSAEEQMVFIASNVLQPPPFFESPLAFELGDNTKECIEGCGDPLPAGLYEIVESEVGTEIPPGEMAPFDLDPVDMFVTNLSTLVSEESACQPAVRWVAQTGVP